MEEIAPSPVFVHPLKNSSSNPQLKKIPPVRSTLCGKSCPEKRNILMLEQQEKTLLCMNK
jgi:hypothetical protein